MNFLRRYVPTFLVILLMLLVPASLVSSFRDGMVRAFRPVSSFLVRESIAFGNFRRNISQISGLRDSNNALQQEVLNLRKELADQGSVKAENDTLRAQLGVTGVTRDMPKLLAHVVLLGSDPLDRTATIDLGSAQGVQKGQPAVSQGFLIGRVISVRTNSSIIQFVTSKESRIQAWDSQNHQKGLLVGDGNIAYLSDIDMSQDAGVKAGDTVETSGLGGSLPQGILIGEVGETVSKKSDLSQKFKVALAQDPSGIDTLFILQTDPQ